MVYYRKYRPQLISELDLESVRNKLSAILSSDNIPHAFLFAGPKGLGKTSSARILAKAINCERRVASSMLQVEGKGKKATSHVPPAISQFEPCNQCSACISITNGSAVDVLEIDAASNRGIDEIRDLRERIKFSPAVLSKKVYIIDEVHMLTTEAFNALLKTLEEPPSHVVFILATTELSKLPETIISRVFYVPFEKPSKEELARSLGRVASGENLTLENGVLEKISELSDGAFRDGAKILEELALQATDKKITLDLLELLYKSQSVDAGVKTLLDFWKKKETEKALDVIDGLAAKNTDFKVFIEKLADKLHAALMESIKSGKTEEISGSKKQLELLDEAYKNLKGAVLPQLPLELAVIEYGIEKSQGVTEPQSQGAMNHESLTMNQAHNPLSAREKSGSSQVPSNNISSGEANGKDILGKMIAVINSENKILAGLLRGCRVEDVTNSGITLKAPSTFHLQKLTEQKNKAVLDKTVGEVLGSAVAIEIKS
ncbi:MAG: DNA polymerase III subunit gamma/tau [Candidatus Levyibacteriota bacterium]